MNEITMIPIGMLAHHPDNPRADLGDLTELADSIRENGVMQNLTVIPGPAEEGKYWVVIGNRRFEAAKMVGLVDLPCRVAQMDAKTAMRTMIAENMQRQDLTLLDQIQGIGKMQQLGMTLPEIAKGTGLSENTIRKRATVGKLPEKSLALACTKGATLFDLLEVAKLEDPVDQAKVLEDFGTNNFQYAISTAIRGAKRKKWLDRLHPKLYAVYPNLKAAGTDRYSGRWKEICRWNVDDETDKPVPEKENGAKYALEDMGSFLALLKEDPEWVKRKAEEKDYSAWMKDRKETAKALNREAYDLRCVFIRSFTLKSGKEKLAFEELVIGEIMKWKSLTHGVGYYSGVKDAFLLRDILAIPYEMERDKEETTEHELARRGVKREAFLLAWALSGGVVGGVRADDGYVNDYNGHWKQNEDLDGAYRILEALGYPMSDFEKSLRDQTHEFFREERP